MKKQIQIPANCPSCDSKLELVNSQLFCRANDCSAQSTKKVEAFVKKMRIKGLGPASISKLGFVQPVEIYETHLDTFVEVLGEKIGHKIFDEVQNSRTTTFAVFLSALSIPLIGDTASKKVAGVCNSLTEMWRHDNLPLGDKATYNIIDHLSTHDDLDKLESHFIFKAIPIRELATRGSVCITGKLKDFSNRTKAKEYLEEHGYTVTSTISGKTNYLVDEEGRISTKSKKAESLGIPIVTIENLIGKY